MHFSVSLSTLSDFSPDLMTAYSSPIASSYSGEYCMSTAERPSVGYSSGSTSPHSGVSLNNSPVSPGRVICVHTLAMCAARMLIHPNIIVQASRFVFQRSQSLLQERILGLGPVVVLRARRAVAKICMHSQVLITRFECCKLRKAVQDSSKRWGCAEFPPRSSASKGLDLFALGRAVEECVCGAKLRLRRRCVVLRLLFRVLVRQSAMLVKQGRVIETPCQQKH
jgi:hypothetical protein